MNGASGKILVGVLGLGVILLAFLLLSNRGYGKVSPRTYELATALYGACLAKSQARLEKVQALLDESEQLDNAASDATSDIDLDRSPASETAHATSIPTSHDHSNRPSDGKLTDTERAWLQAIIGKAQNGKWESAATSARRIMEDQVEY